MPLWLRTWRDDDLAADHGHAADADARRHDPDGPAADEHAPARRRCSRRRDQWYERRRADARRGDRTDGARARDRPLDHALRALRRRGRGRPSLREDQARRSSGSRAPRSGAPSTRPRTSRRSSIPAERIQGGVPSLDWNNMTAWYGGEEGGHIGFSPVAPLTGRDAARAARPAARHGRRRRARLHRGHPPGQRAQLRPHHDGHLRHQERGPGAQPPTTSRSTLVTRGREARLRRVPRASELHGSRGRAVLLRRPRLPALLRDDQGRASTRPGILSPGKQGIWPTAMRDGR